MIRLYKEACLSLRCCSKRSERQRKECLSLDAHGLHSGAALASSLVVGEFGASLVRSLTAATPPLPPRGAHGEAHTFATISQAFEPRSRQPPPPRAAGQHECRNRYLGLQIRFANPCC